MSNAAPPPPIPTPDEYFDRLEAWLALEGDAERERLLAARRRERSGDPERSGETIVGLRPIEQFTGLAGRWLTDLAKPGGEELPMNRLRVGSPVVVSDQSADRPGLAGVVSRRTATQLQVALDEPVEARTVRVDLSPDERTRLKQLAAIARARLLEHGEARLRDALLGLRDPRFEPPAATEAPLCFATELNASQQRAVAHALAARDVAVIHGPPGTGKTTTLAEVVFQAVRRGETVLAAAASNTAVDNLVERLIELMPGVVRVGHPARVFEALRGHTLDELVERDDTNTFVRQLRREADALQRRAQKRSRSRNAGRERGQRFAEARKLRDEARRLERSIVRSVLDHAAVVATTLTLDEELMAGRSFNLLVVDEACQSTEPAVWHAALRADRVVLAGDHRQLPPTVLSPQAAAEGLAISPMERLVDRFGEGVTRRLDV
ncbi:MAG: AAA domain-containing protein, partial [Planctomycetota bacterium]